MIQLHCMSFALFQLHYISFCIIIHSFVYIAYHFAFHFALSCMLLTILYLFSLLSFQARYCMYGSFEAGATRRTAQVLYPPSETYRELHNSLTSFLHCSVVWRMLAYNCRMCASLQLSLHDHKLCSASCIVLHFAPAFGRIP